MSPALLLAGSLLAAEPPAAPSATGTNSLSWVAEGAGGPTLRFSTQVVLGPADLPSGSGAAPLDTDGDGIPGVVVRFGHVSYVTSYLRAVELRDGKPVVSPPFATGATFYPWDGATGVDPVAGPGPIHAVSDHDLHRWYRWTETGVVEVPWPALPGGPAPVVGVLPAGRETGRDDLAVCTGPDGALLREMDDGVAEVLVDGRRTVVARGERVWRSLDLEVRFEGRFTGEGTLVFTRGGAETRGPANCESGG